MANPGKGRGVTEDRPEVEAIDGPKEGEKEESELEEPAGVRNGVFF